MQNENVTIAQELMVNFARRTGLLPSSKPRRYLWTDAFAVCNFLGLYLHTGDEVYKELALRLVDQVHHILGKHREDDFRTGWISGLKDEEAEKHPTIGGLRIGKEMPERKPGEPFDWDLEWKRDGQYYHYLTKWMHTLNRVASVIGDLTYNRWAIELAKTAHSAFTYTLPDGRKRMYWKMSIDLTRPLISSMGQHDPLDGFITYNELQATAPRNVKWPSLKEEIADIESFYEDYWITDDPLGVGELLLNAYKVAQLIRRGYWNRVDLLLRILNDAYISLEAFLKKEFTVFQAEHRLAFRELGLSIGLKTVDRLQRTVSEAPILNGEILLVVKTLRSYIPLAGRIERFWLKPENRMGETWREHIDINEVMLATSLVLNGYLKI
ncbi:hypothetical protein KEJ27_08410 [Candidatus Bathyarchaeota archaeon]|nr:hypothetical protein [Candidatus Bathyarchaeota archaeon]